MVLGAERHGRGARGARFPIARRRAPALRRAKVVFMPTNGIGLGHAQRCTLVAAELDRDRVDPIFAAFPSCTGLVKAYGFDAMPLVQRSALHPRAYENDLVNYLRLKALTDDARTLVFDGGYVFDLVYRTIVENRLAGRLAAAGPLAGGAGQQHRARPRQGVRAGHRADRSLRRAERSSRARRPVASRRADRPAA